MQLSTNRYLGQRSYRDPVEPAGMSDLKMQRNSVLQAVDRMAPGNQSSRLF